MGNCTIEINQNNIANINPFHYRGYYYDSESGLYYLMSRYYDPSVGQFISPDTPDYLAPDTIGGVDLYAYGLNNPVMYVDPNGTSVMLGAALAIVASLGIAAIVGAIGGVAGTFLSDVVASGITGELQFSSREKYLGSALGWAVGGMVSLANPFAGAVAGGTLSTFLGLTIENATGTSNYSWQEIVDQTAIALIVSLATAGMQKYLKIPKITKGSHSWQQVFKSGFTKTLRYGFQMSLKTLAKGSGYLFVSTFSTGFLASNSALGIISVIYKWIKKEIPILDPSLIVRPPLVFS